MMRAVSVRDPLVVPDGFVLEQMANEGYNSVISAIPGFNVKKPIELKIDEIGRRFHAYIVIPGFGYSTIGSGNTREQAAYRAFLDMDKLRQGSEETTNPLAKLTPRSLEALASRYESQ